MKRDFHFSFYSRIFVLAIVGLGFFMLLQKVPSEAEITGIAPGFEFNGWAWSPSMGWLSLNCNNDFDGDGTLDNACFYDYGLSLEVSGASEEVRRVTGCAWAGNIVSYLCFSDPGGTSAPADGIYLNNYYSGFSPDFTGWAPTTNVPNSLCHTGDEECHPSFLFFEQPPDDIWANQFGFPIPSTSSLGPGEVNGCFNCFIEETKECVGGDNDGNSCTITSPDCDDGGTCEVISVNNKCDNCLQYDYDQGTGALQSVIGGYQCENCNNFDDTVTCQASAYQQNNNTCQCDYRYESPGVIVDYTLDNNSYGSMCGWSWQAFYCDGSSTPSCSGPDIGYYGIGWLQFAPRITTSTQPYFAVEGGDIYARGNIRSFYPPPFNRYNAYLIETSGDTIQNVYSYNTTTPSLLTGRPVITFPNASGSGQYTNALGKIDYEGIITEVGSTGKNKYGMVVNEVEGTWQPLFDGNGAVSVDLADTVFYDDSVWVNSYDTEAVTINNNGGTGIIVLDGDVLINRDFVYGVQSPSSIKDIASLVWIVKGDIYVADNVNQLAGTFIALGDGDPADCSGTSGFGDSCGQFYVADGGNGVLVVYGSVLAKKFYLSRPAGIGGEPSEKFINDGRLRINPPAGLSDLSKNMPFFNYNN